MQLRRVQLKELPEIGEVRSISVKLFGGSRKHDDGQIIDVRRGPKSSLCCYKIMRVTDEVRYDT